MTIRTKVTIAGTEFGDYRNLKVSRNMSEYNSSSSFNIIFDSPSGRHNNDFTVGNEIEIFADPDASPTTLLFTGIVERIKFKGKDNTQTVTLSGRDYSARLMDVTVEPIVYTDSEISTIVQNIMDNEVTTVTTNNIDTTDTTLIRIAFNQIPVFDAIKQLAELSGFYFYVDEQKDLHFEKKKNISSGITVDNTNIVKIPAFNTTREGMANEVWVYGDRYLAGFRENLTADTSAGSVFTLQHRPHNSFVELLGSVQQGGIWDLAAEALSGTNYLVDFFDKEIIFISGTNLGDSVPIENGSILITYDRDIPIVKFGRNNQSIEKFGPKTKVIDDKSIKDPNTAKQILLAELENSDPFKGIEAELKGWFTITPGNTVDIVLSDFNLDDTVGILNVTYTFDKNRIQSEKVIKIRLDKKILDITDEIKALRRRLDLIEQRDRQDTDVLTRLELGTGSLLVVGSKWIVNVRGLGSSFILGAPGVGTNPHAGGRLGSIIASGINFLGDSRSGLVFVVSGGHIY